jgi:hypothetical protein
MWTVPPGVGTHRGDHSEEAGYHQMLDAERVAHDRDDFNERGRVGGVASGYAH